MLRVLKKACPRHPNSEWTRKRKVHPDGSVTLYFNQCLACKRLADAVLREEINKTKRESRREARHRAGDRMRLLGRIRSLLDELAAFEFELAGKGQ